MSDVELAQETGAQEAATTETAQEQPQQEQAQAPATEQVDTQEQAQQPRDEKGRYVPQERVNEITRARREAERRAQYLEQQLAQVISQQQHNSPQSNELPRIENFQTVEDWGAAIAEYSARQALSQAEQRFQQHDQQRSTQQLAQGFMVKEQQYAAQHPEYFDAVAELNATVQLPNEVYEAIAHSDHGPAIAHHLAQHLDEADRLSRMPPHIAAVQIGRLEAKVGAPKPKPVTQAPNPPPTLGGSAAVSKDPAKMSYADYVKWRQGK